MKAVYLILILSTFVISTQLFAVEFADDSWYGNDKLAHGFGSYALTDVIDTYTNLNHWQAAIVTSVLGVMWETQTEAVDWKNDTLNSLLDSADHYSYRDISWNIGGALLYCAKVEMKNKDIQINIGKKQFTFGFQIKF